MVVHIHYFFAKYALSKLNTTVAVRSLSYNFIAREEETTHHLWRAERDVRSVVILRVIIMTKFSNNHNICSKFSLCDEKPSPFIRWLFAFITWHSKYSEESFKINIIIICQFEAIRDILKMPVKSVHPETKQKYYNLRRTFVVTLPGKCVWTPINWSFLASMQNR